MRLLLLAAACALPILGCQASEAPPRPAADRATAEEPAVRADINAAYLDPELDVDRLARGFASESREVFAARDAVTAALGIERGDVIVDLGAGTGIYAEPFSRAVGEQGTVIAVDIAENLLAHVRAIAAQEGLGNVRTVLGETASTTLPAGSADLVFTSDVYHHFERPNAMNAHLFEVVRSGGAYAVLDFRRGEDAPDWIKAHVRSDMATVIEEVTRAGFVFGGEVAVTGLDENYLLVFRRP